MKPIAATQSPVPCPTNNLSCVLEGKLTLHQSATFVVRTEAIWTVAYTMFLFAPLTSGSWELHRNKLSVTVCHGMLCFTWLESYITRNNKEYRSVVGNQLPMVKWSLCTFFSSVPLSLPLLSIGQIKSSSERLWEMKKILVKEHLWTT